MIRLQNIIRLLCVATVMTALLAVGTQAQSKPFVPKGGGFNDVVKHLEKNYGAKKTKIPMLGLAKFAIWMVRPAGVKGFKLAVFEDQNFAKRAEAASFSQAMRQAFKKDWSPLVQISSKRDGDNHTFIYIRQSKKDVEFALASLAESEAVVMQVKFNPEAAARFLENPKIMGISLGNSVRGNNTAVNLPAPKPNQTATASATSVDDNSKRIVIKSDNDSSSQPATRPTLSSNPTDESGSPLSASSKEAAKPNEPIEVKTPPREDTLRIETRLVNLNVKALDKSGQPITNLKQEDFAIFEDGVKHEVAYFKPVNAPVNLVMLIDLSGSTQKKRKAMIEAANRFIDSLPAGDKVSLVAFTRQYKPLTDFTSDKKALKEAVKKINKIGGGTAFYDATWKALDQLGKLTEARKAIVVLTDGEDESLVSDRETMHSYDDLLGRASEEDVTIYPIYFSPNNQINKIGILFGGNGSFIGGESKGKTARKQLEELAAQTGGEIFSAQREDDLESAYKMVANELHTLYSLAYSPDKLKHDGQFRKINVKLTRNDSVAKTRRGYFDK
ncbi:MAG: VWA domain-containing protein [Acidobacteria bacterium]|nr:VWA domain-containing protein [Acidobacteriota bacterium]